MRYLRLAITLAVAIAALAVLATAVLAATRSQSSTPVTPLRTRLEQSAGFTRVQTVTIVSAQVATATALTTIWENRWEGLDFPFGFPLPADFATVTVVGTYQIVTNTAPLTTTFGEVFTNTVEMSPTAGLPLYLSYYTNSRAAREGNQYRLLIRASSPQTSTYLTTVAFTGTYRFVSFSDHGPTDTLPLGPPNQATGRVWWGPVVVDPSDKFDKDVVLGDERLLVDLFVQSYGVLVSPDKRNVQVTATIVNSGSVETGSQFVVELYDRPPGAAAPGGPNDHQWGICPQTPECGYSEYRFANAKIISGLQPGVTILITFNYQFHTGGDRKLYLQVDTFGSAVGFNLEPGSGEDNNIVFLGAYQAVGNIYLPLVRKNK